MSYPKSKMVIVFDEPKDITNPDCDEKKFRFPYSIVENQYIGTPHESQHTKRQRITISATRSILTCWKIDEEKNIADVRKVLFQVASDHLKKLIENSEPVDEDILYEIHTQNCPKSCPYDITHIPEPKGARMEVDFIQSH